MRPASVAGAWEDRMDLVYLGLIGLFFAATWGLLALCERLGGSAK